MINRDHIFRRLTHFLRKPATIDEVNYYRCEYFSWISLFQRTGLLLLGFGIVPLVLSIISGQTRMVSLSVSIIICGTIVYLAHSVKQISSLFVSDSGIVIGFHHFHTLLFAATMFVCVHAITFDKNFGYAFQLLYTFMLIIAIVMLRLRRGFVFVFAFATFVTGVVGAVIGNQAEGNVTSLVPHGIASIFITALAIAWSGMLQKSTKIQLEQLEQVAVNNAVLEDLLTTVLPKSRISMLISGKSDGSNVDMSDSVSVVFAVITGVSSMLDCSLSVDCGNDKDDDANKRCLYAAEQFDKVIRDLDELTEKRRLYKVSSTIEGTYLAVAGLPSEYPGGPQAGDNAAAQLAFDFISYFKSKATSSIGVKCGVGHGPAAGGIIGSTRPYYQVISDTINTTSRLATTGLAGTVQCLTDFVNSITLPVRIQENGLVMLKGKGYQSTLFLTPPEMRRRSVSAIPQSPSGRVLSFTPETPQEPEHEQEPVLHLRLGRMSMPHSLSMADVPSDDPDLSDSNDNGNENGAALPALTATQSTVIESDQDRDNRKLRRTRSERHVRKGFNSKIPAPTPLNLDDTLISASRDLTSLPPSAESSPRIYQLRPSISHSVVDSVQTDSSPIPAHMQPSPSSAYIHNVVGFGSRRGRKLGESTRSSSIERGFESLLTASSKSMDSAEHKDLKPDNENENKESETSLQMLKKQCDALSLESESLSASLKFHSSVLENRYDEFCRTDIGERPHLSRKPLVSWMALLVIAMMVGGILAQVSFSSPLGIAVIVVAVVGLVGLFLSVFVSGRFYAAHTTIVHIFVALCLLTCTALLVASPAREFGRVMSVLVLGMWLPMLGLQFVVIAAVSLIGTVACSIVALVSSDVTWTSVNAILIFVACLLGVGSVYLNERIHRLSFLEYARQVSIGSVARVLVNDLFPKKAVSLGLVSAHRGLNKTWKLLFSTKSESSDADGYADPSGSGHFRQFSNVAIIVCDIVEFTSHASSMDKQSLFRLVHKVMSQIDDVAAKHKIFKVDIIGDSYVCTTDVFSSGDLDPQSRSDTAVQFALDAIDAARRIQWSDGSSVAVRVGVHIGCVVMGLFGQIHPRLLPFGDEIIKAMSLEKSGKPNSVHISKRVKDLLSPTKFMVTEYKPRLKEMHSDSHLNQNRRSSTDGLFPLPVLLPPLALHSSTKKRIHDSNVNRQSVGDGDDANEYYVFISSNSNPQLPKMPRLPQLQLQTQPSGSASASGSSTSLAPLTPLTPMNSPPTPYVSANVMQSSQSPWSPQLPMQRGTTATGPYRRRSSLSVSRRVDHGNKTPLAVRRYSMAANEIPPQLANAPPSSMHPILPLPIRSPGSPLPHRRRLSMSTGVGHRPPDLHIVASDSPPSPQSPSLASMRLNILRNANTERRHSVAGRGFVDSNILQRLGDQC